MVGGRGPSSGLGAVTWDNRTEMGAHRLPANFASTANAVLGVAFHAKEALLVRDDFAPTGRHGDAELDGVPITHLAIRPHDRRYRQV